jgi:hypothetical protein
MLQSILSDSSRLLVLGAHTSKRVKTLLFLVDTHLDSQTIRLPILCDRIGSDTKTNKYTVKSRFINAALGKDLVEAGKTTRSKAHSYVTCRCPHVSTNFEPAA